MTSELEAKVFVLVLMLIAIGVLSWYTQRQRDLRSLGAVHLLRSCRDEAGPQQARRIEWTPRGRLALAGLSQSSDFKSIAPLLLQGAACLLLA